MPSNQTKCHYTSHWNKKKGTTNTVLKDELDMKNKKIANSLLTHSLIKVSAASLFVSTYYVKKKVNVFIYLLVLYNKEDRLRTKNKNTCFYSY